MVSEGLPLARQERRIQEEDIIAGEDFLNIIMSSSPLRQHLAESDDTWFSSPQTTSEELATSTIAISTSSIKLPSSTVELPTSTMKRQTSTMKLPTSTKKLPASTIKLSSIEQSTDSIQMFPLKMPTQALKKSTGSIPSKQIHVTPSANEESHVIRQIRSTPFYGPNTESPMYLAKILTETLSIDKPIQNNDNNELDISKNKDEKKFDDTVVIAVSVTSSVGQEVNKPEDQMASASTNRATYVPAEEMTSLISESNKSDFSVEESEPITSNNPSDMGYPASVQAIPNQKHLNTDFLTQGSLKPYGSIIYQDKVREPSRARSVSYSAVIQGVPQQNNVKNWEQGENQAHERQERHYENSLGSYNSFGLYENKKKNDSKYDDINKPSGSMAESKDIYVTSKYNPSEYNESIDKTTGQWKQPEAHQRKHVEPTERNWGIPERNYATQQKPYSPPSTLPLVYGQPEQNYEVDEAVSVMTNGRAHGVQPSQPGVLQQDNRNKPPNTKKDDNQKVGYVVEGRNYRKYRVEERTSDGFIVGEYGVVSHDDGSLRGVRYTADGTISPRLIYDALMKFLSL